MESELLKALAILYETLPPEEANKFLIKLRDIMFKEEKSELESQEIQDQSS